MAHMGTASVSRCTNCEEDHQIVSSGIRRRFGEVKQSCFQDFGARIRCRI